MKGTMNAYDQISTLRLYNETPCPEALEWLREHPDWTLADAWQHCHRADWMLWLIQALDADVDEHSLRVLAVEWRERAYRLWVKRSGCKPGPRSVEAVRVAWRYLRGLATLEELQRAQRSADAYAAAAYAYADACAAAYAYAAAAYAYADACAAAYAYADACAAAYAYADADAAADGRRQADRLRQIWTPGGGVE